MEFISYTANGEDALLWRALSHVGQGRYIDAAALHPDQDSVTRAFYDRGWSGLNIAPTVAMARHLAAARPRDASLAREAAFADLCGHMPGPVHFLRVDGADLGRIALVAGWRPDWRPWLVLVVGEAADDGLAEAGYRRVWFDGVTRFHLALEHWGALAAHFHTPPGTADGILRGGDPSLPARLAQSLARAQAWAARAERAEAAAAGAQSQAAHGWQQAEQGWRQAREAGAALAVAEALLGSQRHAARRAQALLDATRNSTSWRLTAPLRQAIRRARRQPAPPAPPEPDAAELAALAAAAVREHVAPVALPAPTLAPKPAPTPAPNPVQRAYGPTRAVHQAYAGPLSAAPMAAMLLVRGLLRGLGYSSAIFVAPDGTRALADDLADVADLPAHGDYALLLHHTAESVPLAAASAGPMVLVSHAAAVPDYPVAVVAALAASEYHALALRRIGLPHVRACVLWPELAAWREAAAPPGRDTVGDGPFTVLCVGAVTAAHGQLALLRAYVRFRERLGGRARLVLAGMLDDADAARALLDAIEDAGLRHEVLLDQSAGADWYGAAGLYVSMSEDCGSQDRDAFEPLLRAMAHGVPVLSRPAGAAGYLIGEAAATLDDGDPDAAADAMLALARDPAAVLERQRQALDRLMPERQLPALLEALALAGAVTPASPTARAALAAGLRVRLFGHMNGSYSLSATSRELALAWAARLPGRVRVEPYDSAPVPLYDVPDPRQRPLLQALVDRPAPAGGPVLTISQHHPVHLPPDPGDVALALFAWEESVVPAATISRLNEGFDGVLASSACVAKALLDSGLAIPVRAAGYVCDLTAFAALAARPPGIRGRDGVFTFLHVSSCFPRKGLDALLAAYAAAFRAGDRVRLVVKTFPNPHNDAAAQVAAIQAADPALAPITLIDADATPDALLALYAEADAMVLPSRGEGFNLPAAEAMAAGIPLIVTGFGGHMDFCDAGCARLLEYSFAASASHIASPHSVWAEPDAGDLALALREAAGGRWPQATLARARGRVAAHTHAAVVLARMQAFALDRLLAPPPPRLRMAWISSWDVRCGIAEYSRFMLDGMVAGDGPPIPDITILADHRTPASDAARWRVRPAWHRCDPDSIAPLLRAVRRADPHIVVVQHNPGLMRWIDLAPLLAGLIGPELIGPELKGGRVVAITLHNTLGLLQLEPHERAGAIAALATASRVVVHTLADLNLLRQLGLVANVALIPQGVAPSAPPPHPVPEGSAPDRTGGGKLIGCYGFFLRDKGIAELIAALPRLRARWPGTRLRLVNAAYDSQDSLDEIAACRAAAAALGLDEAIEWHTGFLPPAQSSALLSGCDVVALPYQRSREASSAALRSALGAGVPLAVTPLPLFDEAGDAVARLPGTDARAIADGLAALLDDRAAQARLLAAAQGWIAARAWPDIAARTRRLLVGLAVQEF